MTDSEIVAALVRGIRRRGNRWIVLVAVLALAGCGLDLVDVAHRYTCTATIHCDGDDIAATARELCTIGEAANATDWYVPIVRAEWEAMGCTNASASTECAAQPYDLCIEGQ